MGKISDKLKALNEDARTQSSAAAEAQDRVVDAKRDENANRIGMETQALTALKQDLAPLFDEMRIPETMFLLPDVNPLKIARSNGSNFTAFDDSSRILVCGFGKCAPNSDKNVGSNASKYGQGENQRVTISYDADSKTYSIQEQEYRKARHSSGGVLTMPPKGKFWCNAESYPTSGLSKKDAFGYMEERLADVLAHHKRSIPRRVTKFAIATAIAFGITQCASGAEAKPVENSDNFDANHTQTEQVDRPVQNSSTLEL